MFPHSMQITRHPIIYVCSNEALFAKPFQTHHEARQRPILKIGQGKGPFHQNNLKTQSFPQRQKIQNFLVVRISRTKTFQTECVNCFRNKNALRVRKSLFKLYVICQTFPHSLQLAYHPIICEFSNCGFYDKSFPIHRIFKFSNEALFANSFHIHHN